MKNLLIAIPLLLFFLSPLFSIGENLNQFEAAKNRLNSFPGIWKDEISYPYIIQWLKSGNCDKKILILSDFIYYLDQILDKEWENKYNKKNEIYNKLNKINKTNKFLLPMLFWKTGTNFLIWYYDNIQNEDYFNGCFWYPEWDEIFPWIEWWHLILEWFLEKEDYVYNLCHGPGWIPEECDPKNDITTIQYYFKLTKKTTNKTFLDNYYPDHIPLWCEIDWNILMPIIFYLPNSNIGIRKVYTLDHSVLEKLKKSNQSNPIQIYGWIWLEINPHGKQESPICKTYFKTIELMK